MKQASSGIVLILLLFFGLFACSSDPDSINFRLNNNNPEPTDTRPTDPDDTLHVVKVLSGDSIYLKAEVKPQHKAKSLAWDTNGDGVWENNKADKGFILVPFPNPGFKKVTLKVNDDEALSVSKWVYVEEASTDPLPWIAFRKPEEVLAKSKRSSYRVELETGNVNDKEQLSFILNGEPHDFEYEPTTGLITSTLRLKKGDNTLEAFAGEAGSGQVVINYEKPKPTTPSSSRPPKPSPDPPPPKLAPTNPGLVAKAASSYQLSDACLEDSGNKFTIKISPKKDVELTSFKLLTNDCGGLFLSLKGPDGAQTSQRALIKGVSEIRFGDIDARLAKGKTYTLSGTAEAGFGGCSSSNQPQLQSLKNCGAPTVSSAHLSLKGQQTPIIFDLKYLYR